MVFEIPDLVGIAFFIGLFVGVGIGYYMRKQVETIENMPKRYVK